MEKIPTIKSIAYAIQTSSTRLDTPTGAQIWLELEYYNVDGNVIGAAVCLSKQGAKRGGTIEGSVDVDHPNHNDQKLPPDIYAIRQMTLATRGQINNGWLPARVSINATSTDGKRVALVEQLDWLNGLTWGGTWPGWLDNNNNVRRTSKTFYGPLPMPPVTLPQLEVSFEHMGGEVETGDTEWYHVRVRNPLNTKVVNVTLYVRFLDPQNQHPQGAYLVPSTMSIHHLHAGESWTSSLQLQLGPDAGSYTLSGNVYYDIERVIPQASKGEFPVNVSQA
jgi:hypothetical protein